MVTRQLLTEAERSLGQFRALCITGPRQSGKTTLSRQLLGNKPYVSFENPSVQHEAELEPEVFLARYENGAVLDEVQRVPHIFRYLQGILDRNRKRGQFILTGSNNFLLQEQVSQSLAGRAGYLSLLPFSYAELKTTRWKTDNPQRLMLTGGYPEIWNEDLDPAVWMGSYVQTYVQRDVRLLRNISNLAAFTRFVYLCAAYAGQIVNRDEMAKAVGVDSKTVLAWLGLMENGYLIFLLPPWYNNLSKRIVKSPKLYFYDTGLLCHLLGLRTQAALQKHAAYGAVFENWVLSEVRKNAFNGGLPANMYYFRDNVGNEVDLILEREGEPLAIEIKSATKMAAGMLRGLRFWQRNQPAGRSLLVYGGTQAEAVNERLDVVPWTDVADI